MIFCEDDIFVLRRKDLYPITNFKTKDITSSMFVSKHRENILKKALVVFIDDDFKYTILKNRHYPAYETKEFVEKFILNMRIEKRRKIIKKVLNS